MPLGYRQRGRYASIWPKLDGRIWHQTKATLWTTIERVGALLPEPNIPNSSRWKASRGPEFYPYVRHIGGVSLFDFRTFDIDAFEHECVMCNWWDFVPYVETAGGAVWVEVDPSRLPASSRFLTAADLWERQELERAWKHTLMPRIEACVLGSIPEDAWGEIIKIGMLDAP